MRATIISIVILFSLGLLAGCAAQNPGSEESLSELAFPEAEGVAELDSDQHERIADRLADDGRPEVAFVHYGRALRMVPENDPRALTLRVKMGMLLLRDNQDEQALGEFQKVLALDPDHALANEGAGTVYLKAGLLKEAEAHLNKALVADASLWKARHLMGVLHSRSNQNDLAIQDFEASLALSPGQAGTLNNLGVAHLVRGEYREALDSFRRALRAGAPKSKTYNNIGLTLARMGRNQEALEAFRYAGDEARAYNNLGYVLMVQGDSEAAISCFEKAVQLSPTYYAKAFENLKQARLARSFQNAGLGASPQGGARLPLLEEPGSEAPVQTLPQQASTSRPLGRDLAPEKAPEAVQPAKSGTETPKAAPAHVEATASKTPATQTKLYGFHVGSFRDQRVADSEAARFAAKGFDSCVVRVDLGEKGIWYRIMAGRYPSAAAARAQGEDARGKLGIDEIVIKSFKDPAGATPPAHQVL